jgi:hypothetical protein
VGQCDWRDEFRGAFRRRGLELDRAEHRVGADGRNGQSRGDRSDAGTPAEEHEGDPEPGAEGTLCPVFGVVD